MPLSFVRALIPVDTCPKNFAGSFGALPCEEHLWVPSAQGQSRSLMQVFWWGSAVPYIGKMLKASKKYIPILRLRRAFMKLIATASRVLVARLRWI